MIQFEYTYYTLRLQRLKQRQKNSLCPSYPKLTYTGDKEVQMGNGDKEVQMDNGEAMASLTQGEMLLKQPEGP